MILQSCISVANDPDHEKDMVMQNYNQKICILKRCLALLRFSHGWSGSNCSCCYFTTITTIIRFNFIIIRRASRRRWSAIVKWEQLNRYWKYLLYFLICFLNKIFIKNLFYFFEFFLQLLNFFQMQFASKFASILIVWRLVTVWSQLQLP